MAAIQARMEFAPPPTPGLVRSLGLAIAAHALLVVVLAIGVQWRREPPSITVEAELWSAVPQLAAPAPEPEPEPALPTPVPPEVAPPPAPTPDPSIAIERERQRLQLEKDKQLQQAKIEKERRLKEKLLAEKLQKEKDLKEKLAKEKEAAKKKTAQDSKPVVDPKKLADLRLQNMRRMAGLAAGTGDANATGTAAQASGPSAGYAGRIVARIRPNIVFTELVTGNPVAIVQIRTSPSGTILNAKITQSSGIKSWDDAVLRAIEKTEKLPLDTDGRIPTSMDLFFRPNNP